MPPRVYKTLLTEGTLLRTVVHVPGAPSLRIAPPALNGAATRALVKALDAGSGPLEVAAWAQLAAPPLRKELASRDPEAFRVAVLGRREAIRAAQTALTAALASEGIVALPWDALPAVRARVTPAQARALARLPIVVRLGVMPKQTRTAEVTFDSTHIGDVHVWGYRGLSEHIGLVMRDRPQTQSCLNGALVRPSTGDPSWETTTAAALIQSATAYDCALSMPRGGLVPEGTLTISDAGDVGGCDGVCWQLQNGATTIAFGLAPVSSEEADAHTTEYDVMLDELTLLPPFPLFVASAGNANFPTGGPCSTEPTAGYVQNHLLSGLVVGGIDDRQTATPFDDQMYACSSWRNPPSPNDDEELPHLVAPAVHIAAGRGAPMNGTSFAASIVASAAALVRSVNPTLGTWPEALRAILMTTGAGGLDGDLAYGCADETQGCGKDGAGVLHAYWAARLAGTGAQVLGVPGEPPAVKGFDFGTLDFSQDFVNGVFHRGGAPVRWRVMVKPYGTLRVVLAFNGTTTGTSPPSEAPAGDLDLVAFDESGVAVNAAASFDRTVEVLDLVNPGDGAVGYFIELHLGPAIASGSYFGLAFDDRDGHPPRIRVNTPVIAEQSRLDRLTVTPDASGQVTISGVIGDASVLADVAIEVNGTVTHLPPGPTFSLVATLPTAGLPGGAESTVVVTAMDWNANVAEVRLRLFVKNATPEAPAQVVFRMPLGTPLASAQAAAAAAQAEIVSMNRQHGTFVVRPLAGVTSAAVATSLRAQPWVMLAHVARRLEADTCGPNWPDDEGYDWKLPGTYHGGTHAWHLLQAGSTAFLMGPNSFPTCVDDSGCPVGWSCTDTGWAGKVCLCDGPDSCAGPAVCAQEGGGVFTDGYGHSCYVGPYSWGGCILCGIDGADIGWQESAPQICPVEQGPEVIIAIVEPGGVSDWHHPDLAPRVWTNNAECCGAADQPCPDSQDDGPLPDCTAGEARPDLEPPLPPGCDLDPDNGCHCLEPSLGESQRLRIPRHGRCVETRGRCKGLTCDFGIVGKACFQDVDCVPPIGSLCCVPGMTVEQCADPQVTNCGFDDNVCGDCHPPFGCKCLGGPFKGAPCEQAVDCGYNGGACLAMGPFDSCTFGYPGKPGVDDDGDGYTDFADPEVDRLINDPLTGLLHNGVDDDFSCQSLFTAVGGAVPGCIDDASEALLAAYDDDENGVIDDVHGADFALAKRDSALPQNDPNQFISEPYHGFGPLWATTHDDHGGDRAEHATATASVATANVNDSGYANSVPGITPKGRFMTLTADLTDVTDATEYASRHGAKVLNLSAGHYVGPTIDAGCDAACVTDTLAEFLSMTKSFYHAFDPEMVYVNSSGNTRDNLDLYVNALTGSIGDGRWRFPQALRPKPGLIVGSSLWNDRFSDYYFPQSPEFCQLPFVGPSACKNPMTGSGFGPERVDLAAPGDHITAAWSLWTNYMDKQGVVVQGFGWYLRQWTGTSFSAPMVAGAAALVLSAKPELFDHWPEGIMDRLLASVDTVDAASLATYAGKTSAQGRLELKKLIGPNALPYPTVAELPPYVSATWQLRETVPTATHGAVLFRQLATPFPEPFDEVDVLFRVMGSRVGTAVIAEEPRISVAGADGPFQNMPELFPSMPGFYSAVATADFNEDGCTDLVLSGFLEDDPAPPNPSYPFRGRASVMLLQDKDNGACQVSFTGTAPLPIAEGLMSRNVVVADLDADGNDDILIPSTHYEPSGGVPAGGDHWPVWLRGLGDGTFVDASVAIPDDPEHDAFALVPCDVDNDGDLDLIEGGRRRIPLLPQERRPRLLLQTPTALGPTFAVADAVAWNLPVVHRIHEVTCADLDGDGHVDDLLFAHQKVEKTHLLLSTGATFLDRSDLLPNHPGAPGFDFMTGVEWTQSIAACQLEPVPGLAPNAVTLIFANGNINESYTKHQPNLVMSAVPGQPFQATHLLTGLRLERSFDMTEEVVCADLDGNGLADAVFVANNQGRDYLWRYRTSGTGP